jgi:tetratricopeptide (TPR) repeat protein
MYSAWLRAINSVGPCRCKKIYHYAVQMIPANDAMNPMSTTVPEKLKKALELHRAGRLAQAQAGYGEILAIQPGHAEAINLLGAIAIQMGNPQTAVELFGKAIEIDPNNVAAYCNCGLALRELKQLDAALARFEQAIALKADCSEAYSNRGLVLCELKQWEAALASYQQAIAIEPDYAEAHLACGRVLQELRRSDAALSCCDRAIAIVPDYEEAYLGRAILLYQGRQMDAALTSYDQAIAIKPDYATAHHGRSHTHLLLGDLDKGWIGYEWRWKDSDCLSTGEQRDFSQPLWLGKESIAGKTILLYSEQGLGDALQFCRYARLVSDLGARVILEVHAPLRSLLAKLEGVSQLVTKGDALPDFDYQCPLLSLPLAFKTRLNTIPSSAKYVASDSTKVASWQRKLGEKAQPRIGLVWSGNPLHKNDENRSILLAALLQHLPTGLQYVSLQKEVRECDRQILQSSPTSPTIRQFSDELHDFSDTAALCDCMDVVISVDTSVAHLSGALGKDTWILLPFVSDWRWLLDRDDSPWYPTARLFRQDKFGDWNGVFERVKASLMQLFFAVADDRRHSSTTMV